MKLKNIIVVCDFGYIEGGASKVAITSAIALSDLYNVTFFCGSTVLEEPIKKSGMNVISLNNTDILHDKNRLRAFVHGLWNRQAYKKMDELLSNYSSDDTIVHVHSYTKVLSPSIFKALALHGHNVVITTHDYFQICGNGGLFNYKLGKKCHVRPQSLKCFFCNCDVRRYVHKVFRFIRLTIQQKFVSKIRNLNAIYISNLNKTLLSPYLDSLTKTSILIKNPIDINSNTKWADVRNNNAYLYVGRVCKEKGVSLFCEAIDSLGLKGIVIGDGPCKQELESKCPNIQFVGWKTGREKDDYLYQGKALVFPSLWYEGAPLTIVEAKSYGLPCIVADDCAAIEDIVDGEEGYSFKSGDLESLKNVILKLERSNVGTLQDNIIKRFDPLQYRMERYAQEIISYFEKILSTYSPTN